jgi:acyl-homoserine-lactone acylase
MLARTISLPPVAGAAPVQHTVYSTHWGPVLVIPRAGLAWSSTTAYAIADANTLNVRSLDAWMAMNRARSVEDLRAAMGQQAIPWVNTIAADRAGNAIADLSVVPDVSADMLKRCAPSPRAAALFAAAGLPVLNGSRADCAWNRDAAAAVPGLTPAARMPVLITPEWVQNSNDSFWCNPIGRRPAPLRWWAWARRNGCTRSTLAIGARLTAMPAGNKMV